jgi:hypothetical protein
VTVRVARRFEARVPGTFGAGKYCSSARAVGDSIALGITLPGNGWPVNGLRIAVVISEKLPSRMAALGTVAKAVDSDSERVPS